jgi:enoyl-CoA hydratase/carnithine racemase
MPAAPATQRLTLAVGKFAAMKLMLTGRPLAAQEVRALGRVSEVVADKAVLSTALDLAREMAALPALALRQVKELVLASMNLPLDAGLSLERKAFQPIFSTGEKTERIRAFLK